MKELKIHGKDPNLIFDFLSRLLEEANSVDINDGQLMVCTPYMLTKTTIWKCSSISSGRRVDVLAYCTEAVQYLLT